ncbi:flagellar hook-basal body protein [Geobacter sp. AOG2]|uniref:flagellar hook-basal body protein n=1 Tax=Geobacter sp. AOG2 TaxID=1566347 RepID=UPI001CC3A7C9|nr:flagellar hook basal-body protein [Geobacter sp. AOG2]GFE59489.1 flagellar basal body protein [Geobacter sp. AOG2]
MSLTSAMYTGTSGLLSQAQAISVIGNNLANTNTVGYKTASTLFSDLLYQTAGNNSQIGTGVKVQSVGTNFTEGSLAPSTNVTDLAIQGNGFFALCGPGSTSATAATAYYSRAGSFKLDSTGLGLVNSDGYKVLGADGNAIVFAGTYNDGTNNLTFSKVSGVDSNGNISLLYSDAAGNTATVYYAGSNGTTGTTPVTTVAGGAVAIAEATVANPDGMAKQGNSLYKLTSASGAATGTPAAGMVFTAANGTSETMLSNYLEQSNVDMATELVSMITTQRAYSANSKTITTADQMTQEVLSLKQ